MAMPRCAICHNRYDAIRVPYILQPCAHGLCKLCIEEYVNVRGSTTCPTCRAVIEQHTINFDLNSICSARLESWKELLMESLSEKPNLTVTISDDLMPVAGLIRKRVSNNRDIHKDLVTLVRHCEDDTVYSWIDALQFPTDWYVDRKIAHLIRHHTFLKKHEAGWLLEYF
jgi:hypothetical protein